MNEAIIKDSRANLKKSNQYLLCDFCGCTPEIMIRSNMQRSIRKGFLANVMIDDGNESCPIFMNMMKTMPKKWSEKTIEIMNDHEIIKNIYDEC